jgi:hypothetical protein
LLVAVFIITHLPFNDGRCESLKEYKDLYINGRVINKYIDSTQHSYPIVLITNINLASQKLNLAFDTTDSYLLINIGDSLLKKRDELLLVIKKRKKTIKKIIDFGCHLSDPPLINNNK